MLAREGLASAAIPLLYLAAYSALFILWSALHGESPAELLFRWRELVERYGVPILLLAAFLEGLVLLTTYFPGSVVVFLAVATSVGRPMAAVEMVIAVTIGFLAAAYCNYFVGRVGFYRVLQRAGLTGTLNRARALFERYGIWILLIGFVHPASSSLLAVSAGIGGMRIAPFSVAAIVGITVWNALLGAIAYSLGTSVETAVANPWLMSWFLALWALAAFALGARRAASQQS